MKKRAIGIHIRLQESLQEGLEKAERIGLPVYQCFLMDEIGNYFELSDSDIERYIKEADEKNINVIIHAAYWSSITKMKGRGFHALKQEAAVLTRLKRRYLIVHSGSIKGMSKDPVERAKEIAITIDDFVANYPDVLLLLENSPHGGSSYGGDLEDFALLLEHVKDKDSIGFCIDTSHAHAYGYDIVGECDQFMNEIDRTIGFERVKVLHLNDTLKKRGSKIDQHGLFGEGVIGLDCLKKFVQSKKLEHAIVLLELPKISEEEEVKALEIVNQWAKGI